VVFDFEQPSLYLGKVSSDASTEKSAFILVKNLEDTEVLEVSPSSEFIKARMLDFKDNNGQYDRLKLEVTTLPGLPLGRINETVTVRTNLADKPTAVLRLTGSVIGDVEVTPEWMTFVVTDGENTRSATLTKKIFISNHVSGANLEIVSIKDTENHLDLDLRPLTEGQKYELTATLRPESIPERGNISGNVVLTTNFPSQKEVAIRYSAVRKSYQEGHDKRNTSRKAAPPAAGALRDGQTILKDGEGEGLFAASKDDPFAVGGELTSKDDAKGQEKIEPQDPAQAKQKLSSQKEVGKKKPPDDEAATDDPEKKEEKEETKPTYTAIKG
jgi:hypothetical protein